MSKVEGFIGPFENNAIGYLEHPDKLTDNMQNFGQSCGKLRYIYFEAGCLNEANK